MNIQHIVDYLETGGFGIQGQTLFRTFLPNQVTEGCLVTVEEPSSIDPYIPQLRNGEFQVILRGLTEQALFEKGNEICNYLIVNNLTMGSTKFLTIRPKHEPMIFPRSEGDFVEAYISFDSTFVI